jgi:hypothetical protein
MKDSTPLSSDGRLVFVDNMRIFLAVTVVVFHVSIAYGADHHWVYHEPPQDELTSALLNGHISIHHAYCMGLYFFLAGYFTPGAYHRRGSKRFVEDRLLRLGVPVLVYFVVIMPVLIYLYLVNFYGASLSFPDFYLRSFQKMKYVSVGPTWFILVLLVYSLIYAALRSYRERRCPAAGDATAAGAPGNLFFLGLAVLLAMATVLVRLRFSIGVDRIPIIGVDLAYQPQYITMYVLGITFYNRRILHDATRRHGRVWLWLTAGSLLGWGVLVSTGRDSLGNESPFLGGNGWQAMLYGAWESVFCVGMLFSLMYIFMRRLAFQGRLARALRANAYAVYLVHPPLLVGLQYLFRDLEAHNLQKFLLVTLLGVPASFLVSHYIVRRLPYAGRIL